MYLGGWGSSQFFTITSKTIYYSYNCSNSIPKEIKYGRTCGWQCYEVFGTKGIHASLKGERWMLMKLST